MVKRTYECMVLLDNREVRQGWQQVKDTVTGVFTKHGAEIVSARLWDERRLAYPIRQQRRGTYLLIYFDAETEALAPLSRDLEFSEAVLRHLVLSCEEVPPEAHEPEKEFDVSAIGEDEAAAATREEEAAGEPEGGSEPEPAGSGDEEEGGASSEGVPAEESTGSGAEASGTPEETTEESGQDDERGDRG